MSIPWWQLVIRAVAVYVFLLLANAVQSSINGGDNSLVGGLIGAAALITLNHLFGYITFKSKRLEHFVEGRPKVIIHNGHLYADVMRTAQLTHHELNSALRQAGCAYIGECRYAILENNGAISVVKKETGYGKRNPHKQHAPGGARHGIAGRKASGSAHH